MQTRELTANGHARFDDADFAQILHRNDLPLQAMDPTQSHGPIAQERKPLRSVAFQKLLAEIECEEGAEPEANRPAFPLQALPQALREWVEGVVKQTQTAPEAAAMLGLAASSAALAGKVSILGSAGVWQPVNLYVGLLTGGDRTDEVMAAAIEPLRELEFQEFEIAEQENAKDRVCNRDYDKDLRQAQQKAIQSNDAADDDDDLRDLLQMRVDLERFEPRPAPRRILEDVTARSLRYQLAQRGSISVFSPSGEIFRQIAGRSSASRQRLFDTLDAGHAARPLIVDGPRGKQTPVKSPTIAIASLVDRSLVAAIAGGRECQARSLLARFLFVSPPSRVGSRERGKAPAAEVVAAYRQGICELANRKSAPLVLSPEAFGALARWEIELEPQLGPRGSLAPIGEWGKHLVGATLRIAGILHAWTSSTNMVSPQTFAAAIEIARWLVPQAALALEALGAADDSCSDRERALLRYARSASAFSPRDAWQHLRKTMLHTRALRRSLAQLVRRGYLQVAREGDCYPRRFGLAALSVILIPLDFTSRRAKKKAGREAQPMVAPPPTPIAAPPNESTKGTQPMVGVPPLGGLKAG